MAGMRKSNKKQVLKKKDGERNLHFPSCTPDVQAAVRETRRIEWNKWIKFNCFSRFLCLPLVCAVSVLHVLCLLAQVVQLVKEYTHWVQGVVTSCLCLVFDSLTVVLGSGTVSGGGTAT